MAASANPLLAERETRDPTLFCTAFKRSRFYLFSQLQPEDTKGGGDRDVFNEKPTREEQSLSLAQPAKTGGATALGKTAVIHTTKGDIVRGRISIRSHAASHVLTPFPSPPLVAVIQALPRPGAQGCRELLYAGARGLLQRHHLPPHHQEICAPFRRNPSTGSWSDLFLAL
jgi:hypothetical protein